MEIVVIYSYIEAGLASSKYIWVGKNDVRVKYKAADLRLVAE